MTQLTELINGLKVLNLNELQTAITFLGGGAAVSAFVQTLKHKFQLFEDKHKKYNFLWLVLGSVGAAAANYLVSHSTQSWTVIIAHTTEIMVSALTVYLLPKIGISDVYLKKVAPFLKDLAQVKAVNQPQKTTPTQPVEFQQ